MIDDSRYTISVKNSISISFQYYLMHRNVLVWCILIPRMPILTEFVQLGIYLPPAIKQSLDRYAKVAGGTRMSHIRKAIEEYLESRNVPETYQEAMAIRREQEEVALLAKQSRKEERYNLRQKKKEEREIFRAKRTLETVKVQKAQLEQEERRLTEVIHAAETE